MITKLQTFFSLNVPTQFPIIISIHLADDLVELGFGDIFSKLLEHLGQLGP